MHSPGFNRLFLKCYLIVHYSSSKIFLVLQKAQKQNTTTGLRTCNNILSMAQVSKLNFKIQTHILNLLMRDCPEPIIIFDNSATTCKNTFIHRGQKNQPFMEGSCEIYSTINSKFNWVCFCLNFRKMMWLH